MAFKFAFIFLSPDGDPEKHKAIVSTPSVEAYIVAAKNYAEATKVAKKLIEEEGIEAFELCGGFGHKGVVKIVEAVEGKIPVGAIRFDNHPILEGKSGDEIF